MPNKRNQKSKMLLSLTFWSCYKKFKPKILMTSKDDKIFNNRCILAYYKQKSNEQLLHCSKQQLPEFQRSVILKETERQPKRCLKWLIKQHNKKQTSLGYKPWWTLVPIWARARKIWTLFSRYMTNMYYNNATRSGEWGTSLFLPTYTLRTVWLPRLDIALFWLHRRRPFSSAVLCRWVKLIS